MRIRNQGCSGNSYSDIRYNGACRWRFMELLSYAVFYTPSSGVVSNYELNLIFFLTKKFFLATVIQEP
jgi:hypothetical protein